MMREPFSIVQTNNLLHQQQHNDFFIFCYLWPVLFLVRMEFSRLCIGRVSSVVERQIPDLQVGGSIPLLFILMKFFFASHGRKGLTKNLIWGAKMILTAARIELTTSSVWRTRDNRLHHAASGDSANTSVIHSNPTEFRSWCTLCGSRISL